MYIVESGYEGKEQVDEQVDVGSEARTIILHLLVAIHLPSDISEGSQHPPAWISIF